MKGETLRSDERLIVYKQKHDNKKLSLSLWAATRMTPGQHTLYERGLAIHKMHRRCLNGAMKTLERYNISYMLPKTYKEAHNLDPNCLGLS